MPFIRACLLNNMSGSKPFIASVSVGLVALFFLPGQEGAYRLSKWGISGFALLLLSGAFLFSRKKSSLPLLPKETFLFGIVLTFIATSIIIPAGFTPFTNVHIAGALRLLMGFSFAYLTTLAFQEWPLLKRRGISYIAAAGGLSSVIVILQALGIRLFEIPFPGSVEFRSPGTFGNPNWAAAFLLALAPLSLSLISSSHSHREKMMYRGLTLLIIVATFSTLSKAGVLALLGGLIVYYLMGHELKPSVRYLSILVSVLLATSLLLLIHGNDYLAALPWIRGRLFLWQGALVLISDHPIAGVGLGGYLPSYLGVATGLIHGDPTVFMPLSRIDFLHNDPLQIAVEGGLLSGFSYLALVCATVWIAYKRNDVISRGVGAAVSALFLNGLADSPLQVPATFFLFWFLVGWTMSGDNDETSTYVPENSRKKHWSVRAIFTAGMLLIASLGFVQGIRFTIGNYFWSKGNMLVEERKASGITALRIAAECLPEIGNVRSSYAKSLVAAGLDQEAVVQLDAASSVYSDFNDRFLRLRLLGKTTNNANVNDWQQLDKDFPALVTPHIELGTLYLNKGDKRAAVQEFLKVVGNKQNTKAAGLYREKARYMLEKINTSSEITVNAKYAPGGKD